MACLLRRADLEHPEPAFLVPHTARKADKKPWFQELRNFFYERNVCGADALSREE
jgi:hypothetical protein